MFAKIKTNGADHILINIPHANAAASLPALSQMLENNTVFVKEAQHYYHSNAKLVDVIVKPEITIVLGDSYTIGDDQGELLIKAPASNVVIEAPFEPASPELFQHYAKFIERKDREIAELKSKISSLDAQLTIATNKIEALEGESDE